MRIHEILTEDVEQLDELNWKKAAAAATLAGAGLFGGGQSDAQGIDPSILNAIQTMQLERLVDKTMAAFESEDVLKLSYLIGLLEPYYENNLLSTSDEQAYLADIGMLRYCPLT